MSSGLPGYLRKVIEKAETFDVSASITRPANASAYAAGDAIADTTATASSAVNTFASVSGVNGGRIRLDEVSCTLSVVPGTTPTLELWILDSEPTAQADNAGLDFTDAENNTVVAVIPLVQTFSATNNMRLEATNLNRFISLASGTTTLWWELKVTNATTPSASDVYTVKCKGLLIDELDIT